MPARVLSHTVARSCVGRDDSWPVNISDGLGQVATRLRQLELKKSSALAQASHVARCDPNTCVELLRGLGWSPM